MATALSYSASGALVTGTELINDNRQTIWRYFFKVAVGAGETVTLDDHGVDTYGMRTVDIWDLGTNQPYAGATVTKTDSNTTTIAFTDAGSYSVLIQY
jgi:hypothetical protein